MAEGGAVRVTFVLLVAAAVGVAAVALQPEPTGSPVPDVVLAAASGVVVALAGSRAAPWTWLVLAGSAAGLADGDLSVALGAVGLAIALVATLARRTGPIVGGVAVGASYLGLLAGTTLDVHGVSALVTVVAVTPVLLSAYGHAPRGERRIVRVAAVGVFAFLVLAGAAAAVAALSARSDVERGIDELDRSLDVAADGDAEAAARELDRANRSFTSAHRRLDAWWVRPALAVPVLGQNLRATTSLAAEAAALAEAAADGARRADVDSLRLRQGALDLDRMRDLEEPLREVAARVRSARRTVGRIDTPWLLAPIDQRLDVVREDIGKADRDAELAVDAVRLGPAMLGGGAPRRYLTLFLTPVEARGRFGFPGNYAELTLTEGRLEMTDFGRITELEDGLGPTALPPTERTLAGPAEYLARYGRFEPAATWRNITMAPDLPSIAQVAAQLYPQSGGAEIDGLLVVDPLALAELMADTGPVAVEGLDEPIDAANAARFLLRDQYLALEDKADRIDALETIARTTFDRLTSASLPGPRALGDRFGPLVRGGHLAFTTLDPEEAALLARLDLAGEVADTDGDHLMVTSSNAAGNKIDLFLERDLRYEATWDPATGRVRSRAVVTLRNTAPAAGLPDYVIGNAVGNTSPTGQDLPVGTNKVYLTVYSPLAVQRATLDGQDVVVESLPEVGMLAHATFITLGPGQSAVLQLDLAGTLARGPAYSLTLEAGHLVEPDEVSLELEATTGLDEVQGLPGGAQPASGALVLDRRRTVVLRAR